MAHKARTQHELSSIFNRLQVNLTQKDMNPEKWAKFLEYDFVPDSVEFYPLLETIVREELRCRVGCRDVVATINGELDEGYFSRHFNYLQFSYYKCEWVDSCRPSNCNLDPLSYRSKSLEPLIGRATIQVP